MAVSVEVPSEKAKALEKADMGGPDWLLALVAVGRLQVERAEADLRASVAAARLGGCTWSQVADRLEVTRQAASQRYMPSALD